MGGLSYRRADKWGSGGRPRIEGPPPVHKPATPSVVVLTPSGLACVFCVPPDLACRSGNGRGVPSAGPAARAQPTKACIARQQGPGKAGGSEPDESGVDVGA